MKLSCIGGACVLSCNNCLEVDIEVVKSSGVYSSPPHLTAISPREIHCERERGDIPGQRVHYMIGSEPLKEAKYRQRHFASKQGYPHSWERLSAEGMTTC